MSDHALLGLLVLVQTAMGLAGLLVLGLQVREARREVQEAQRQTRLVATLVVQETDKIPSKTPKAGSA